MHARRVLLHRATETGKRREEFLGRPRRIDTATGSVLAREEQDRRNNEKLIGLLKGARDRRAHYYCVIVLMASGEDPEPVIVEGRWHGEVVDAPRGSNGFGYDPHFYLPEFGCTAAELAPERKNAVSHRGRALSALLGRLSNAPGH